MNASRITEQLAQQYADTDNTLLPMFVDDSSPALSDDLAAESELSPELVDYDAFF